MKFNSLEKYYPE